MTAAQKAARKTALRRMLHEAIFPAIARLHLGWEEMVGPRLVHVARAGPKVDAVRLFGQIMD